ncbi:membrane bound O-acyltransferase [Umbelopsis sp. AD052]|nr:membrane bound O-acyltransferase [Umbelopsis sp. AD052]
MFLDPYFDQAGKAMDMPPDHLKIVFSIFMTYPYAYLYNRLPNNPNIKHLYSIVLTCVTMLWFHRIYEGFAHIIVSSIITLVVTKYYKDKRMPWVNFVLLMIHMSISHIQRQRQGHLGDDQFDHTGPQMVLVIKLTSFAFNVFDATQPSEKLTDYNKTMMVREFPSVIEYYGWVLFFGGFIAGPANEYMDYKRFVTMEVFRDANGKIVRPSATKATLKLFAQGLFFILILATVAPHFSYFECLNPWYLKMPFWKRFLFIQAAGFSSRVKYYAVWLLAEGACVLCGLGFNGYDKDGKARWNRVSNIRPFTYESGESIKVLLEAWNMRTNVWLKNYVYLRVSNGKPGFGATVATFATSALWHGFHPGYYLTFVSGSLVQNVAKKLRRLVRPFFFTPDLKHPLPTKRIYDLYGYIAAQSSINMIAGPFLVLELNGSLLVWKSVYFYVHVAVFVIEGLFAAGLGKKLKALQKTRAEKAGVQLQEIKPREDKVIVSEVGVEFADEGGVRVGKKKLQ